MVFIESIKFLPGFDSSKVTDMSYMLSLSKKKI